VRVTGFTPRLVGALALAVTGGLALTAILQFWLGSLDGNYWANSAVVALVIAAIAVTLLGLESLFGHVGLGLGAAVMVLLGNPLSGLTTAPEMLPTPWGALGQLLPPGAGGTLLRTVAFFPDGPVAAPLAVLLAWLAGGLALCAAGTVLTNRGGRTTGADHAPDADALATG
jgi:hypothetical protein